MAVRAILASVVIANRNCAFVLMVKTLVAQHSWRNCLPLQLINPDSFRLRRLTKMRRQFLDWGVFHVEQRFISGMATPTDQFKTKKLMPAPWYNG